LQTVLSHSKTSSLVHSFISTEITIQILCQECQIWLTGCMNLSHMQERSNHMGACKYKESTKKKRRPFSHLYTHWMRSWNQGRGKLMHVEATPAAFCSHKFLQRSAKHPSCPDKRRGQYSAKWNVSLSYSCMSYLELQDETWFNDLSR
jgi:hypothetical protein